MQTTRTIIDNFNVETAHFSLSCKITDGKPGPVYINERYSPDELAKGSSALQMEYLKRLSGSGRDPRYISVRADALPDLVSALREVHEKIFPRKPETRFDSGAPYR